MKEGIIHTHTAAEAPTPGKTYQCVLNGTPLYEAHIRNVSGCWATIEVVQPLPGPHQHNYKAGQTFDIRVGSYTFREES